MAAENNDTGFLIEGKLYPVPTMDSLTMAERRVMYDLSGITQEDFVREEDESDEDLDARVNRLTRHPGFMEALMHVAYQRGNPNLRRDKVQFVIDQTNYNEAVAALAATAPEEDTDQPPLALTSEPDESSPRSSLESVSLTKPSSESGGSVSTNGSDLPAGIREPTGTSRSATSSPLSIAETSGT